MTTTTGVTSGPIPPPVADPDGCLSRDVPDWVSTSGLNVGAGRMKPVASVTQSSTVGHPPRMPKSRAVHIGALVAAACPLLLSSCAPEPMDALPSAVERPVEPVEVPAPAAAGVPASLAGVTTHGPLDLATACSEFVDLAADYTLDDQESAVAFYDLAQRTEDQQLAAAITDVADAFAVHAPAIYTTEIDSLCSTV